MAMLPYHLSLRCEAGSANVARECPCGVARRVGDAPLALLAIGDTANGNGSAAAGEDGLDMA